MEELKWIELSVLDYFKGSITIPSYEGNIGRLEKNPHWVEIYYDLRHKRLQGEYRADVSVTLLLVSKIDKSEPLKHLLLGSEIQGIFEKIPVYKYGDKASDDKSKCDFCLFIEDEFVQKTQFGKVSPDSDILQTTIQADYTAYF